MAITMTGSGGLFTRLGRFGRFIDIVNRFRGNYLITFVDSAVITDLPAEIKHIFDNYALTTASYQLDLDGLAQTVSSACSGLDPLLNKVQSVLQALFIEQVYDDVVLPARTVAYALAELISQMVAGGYYVSSPSISSGITPGGSNYGNGTLVVSLKDALGKATANVFAETLAATISGGGTAGSEQLSFLGQEPSTSSLAMNWPYSGSGANQSLTAVAVDGSASKLTNGSFDGFSANVPNSWTIDTGTAGTTVKQNSSTKYSGTSALEFDGNGAELTKISQTLTGLKAKTPYALAFACKVDVVPAAGVLTVDLFDGTSVINDEAGTANSMTVNLVTVGTTFVLKTATFCLPEPVPATVKLRVRLSTALSNTSSALIDHLTLSQMTELYTHGPFVAAISGSLPYSNDDVFKLDIVNDLAGRWQQFFDKVFDMRGKRLLLPTAGTTAINDNLLN
jgi:hypothetical protein